MDSEFVEIKDLAEEEIAGGSEAAEEMFTENDDLPGGRRGLCFLAGGAPGDASRDEPRLLIALEGVLGQQRSALVGRDGPPGCRRSSGGGGGNVDHRAHGFLSLSGFGELGCHSRGEMRMRVYERARAGESTEEEDEAGTERIK